MDNIASLDTPGDSESVKVVEWNQNQLIRSLWIWGCSENAHSNRILTLCGLQSNCRMCNQDVEKNCYYVREYLGDTSSYDAHLFFCFHDFRREFYMIWDHICLLIDMFEFWNKLFFLGSFLPIHISLQSRMIFSYLILK